jgi:two-component system, cell cycle sensor histidine kinase and response regulator CckA
VLAEGHPPGVSRRVPGGASGVHGLSRAHGLWPGCDDLSAEIPTRPRRPRRKVPRAETPMPEMEAVNAAIDALPIGVVLAECEAGGKPVVVGHNSAFARIVGETLAPGMPFEDARFDLFLPDRMTRLAPGEWPSGAAACSGCRVGERELHLRRANGEWRVILASAAPFPGEPSDPVGRAAGVLLDVTDRTRAEEDLSRRGQLLRLVIEASPDPVFVKNRESQLLYANAAWLAAIGKAADAVMGRSDRELFADRATADAIVESDRRIMERGAPEAVEEQVPTPAGERTLLTTKTPWRGPSGQVIGLVGIGRDITERKHAEEALQRSERRFRTLIERSSDMLLLVDGDGRVQFWSPAASEVLGWSEAEVAGTPAVALVHPGDRRGVTRTFLETLRAPGIPVRHRARMRHRDGSHRIIDGVARDLRDDPAIGAVVLNLRDVTVQVRAEERLLESRKLDGIGRIAGGIAHDFNNLLTAILCGAEAEREALAAGKPVALEDVEQIRGAVERARDLVGQLLAFARRQAGEATLVDLNALVEQESATLAHVLGDGVRLTRKLGGGLWPVRCGPAQLEKVLVHLAANARDAMPRGGTLDLSTDNVVATGEGGALPAGEWVRLRVADSGSGMSSEVREHLFEPFFTTRRARGRTGLGLATVYGIVRQAGGYVRVESRPGDGSTFEILLPRAFPTKSSPGPRESAPVAGGSETVLLVEDDPSVREAAARSLRAGGYRVIAADGVESAIAAVSVEEGNPALLVTDVLMPQANGRELAFRLQAGQPGLKVLYLSGHAPEVVAAEGVLEAPAAFLAKPFTPAALLGKVRQVLDSR